MGPYVEKIQKGTGGVAQGVGPEFKPKCYKKIYIYIFIYNIYIERESQSQVQGGGTRSPPLGGVPTSVWKQSARV
jgi:hypothetical protein